MGDGLRPIRVWQIAAVAALAALTQFSCSSSSGPQASAPRLSSPSSAVVNPADSKAADLRTRLDLLLGEHVIVVAKESAAAAAHNDEYMGYLSLLTNATDLVGLMRSAFGDSAAGQFEQMWAVQNNYLVDYTIGLVTHNKTKSNGAMSGLINGFVRRQVNDPSPKPAITTRSQWDQHLLDEGIEVIGVLVISLG